MDTAIMVAVITGGCAIITTYLTVRSGNEKIMLELEKHQAVQDEKIENLTKEVKEHNEFAKRMPVLEEKVKQLEKDR